MYAEANDRDKKYVTKEKGDLISNHSNVQQVIKRPEVSKFCHFSTKRNRVLYVSHVKCSGPEPNCQKNRQRTILSVSNLYVTAQVQAFIDNLETKFLGEVAQRNEEADEFRAEVGQVGVYPECLLGLDPFNYIREVIVFFKLFTLMQMLNMFGNWFMNTTAMLKM